ncbi:hypothetical protein Tco_0511658 [Tanacetum coccineum]
MSDMTACLNDLSYIPLNNEQNKPTQGDIGETSNDPTQAKRNEFEELYASANEELYPGCDHVTRLDFMQSLPILRLKGWLADGFIRSFNLVHLTACGRDTDNMQCLPPWFETIDVATATASPSHVEPIPTVASSSHPKKSHKHRKGKRLLLILGRR